MNIFLAVCAGVATATLVVAAFFLVRTMIQVRRTAAAVERLAARLDSSADAMQTVALATARLAGGLQSKWMQAFHLGMGVFSSLKEHFARDSKEGEGREEEKEEKKEVKENG